MYTDFIIEGEFSDIDSPLVAFPEARHHPRGASGGGGRGHPSHQSSFQSPRSKRIKPKAVTNGPSPTRGSSAGGSHSPDVARIYLSRNRHETPGRVPVGAASGGGFAASTTPSHTHPSGCTYIPSKIPDNMRIVKQVMTRDKGEAGFLNPDTNMWNTVVFPRQFPDSREDVSILESWMKDHLDDPSEFKARVASDQCESASLLARHQLHILDLAHSELVRQVAIHCQERGQLMETTWSLNSDLYRTVIKEQQAVMQGMHRRVLDAVVHSEQMDEQMKLMERNHKEEVAELLANSEMGKKEKENSAFRKLQQDMISLERDMKIMESTLADLSVWFPNFHLYSNSILRRLLPDGTLKLDDWPLLGGGGDDETNLHLNLPQNRLFRDLKRIECMELGFSVCLEDETVEGSERPPNSSRFPSAGDHPASRGSAFEGFYGEEYTAPGSASSNRAKTPGIICNYYLIFVHST